MDQGAVLESSLVHLKRECQAVQGIPMLQHCIMILLLGEKQSVNDELVQLPEGALGANGKHISFLKYQH